MFINTTNVNQVSLKMQNIALNSTIHGVSYIFDKERSKIGRITWIILLIASFCGFSFYFYNSYMKFQFSPDIAMKREEKLANNYSAAALTICPNMFYRMDFREHKEIIFGDLNAESKLECKYLLANSQWCSPYHVKEAISKCEKLIDKNEKLNVLELVNQSAYSTDDTFNYFSLFMLKRFLQMHRIFTHMGICFTTNMQDFSTIFNKEIHEDFNYFRNPNESLKDFPLTVDTRLSTFLQFNMTLGVKVERNTCITERMKLIFHKPSEIPTEFHKSFPISYGTISTVYITVKSQKTDENLRSYSPDIRKCFFEGEKKLKLFKTYSKAHCEIECKTDYFLNTSMGCVPFFMPRDKTMRICQHTEMEDILQLSDQFNRNEKLYCGCLPACNDVTYNIEVSPISLSAEVLKL